PVFAFGAVGSWPVVVPVVGDWDGDGVDGIGTYAAGTWTLRNSASAGPASIAPFVLTLTGPAYPVGGDWNGDGTDTVGAKDSTSGSWHTIDVNGPIATSPSGFIFNFGVANDLPVVWEMP